MSMGTPSQPPASVEAQPLPVDPFVEAGIGITNGGPASTEKKPRLPAGARAFLSNRKAVFGLTLFMGIVILAILAPVLANHDPNGNDYEPRQSPSAHHPFGTTDYAQDLFSMVLWGARVSLLVGAGAAAIATAIATAFGLLAAYRPGVIDGIVNMFTNIFLVIPLFPLLIVISAFVPQRGGVVIMFMIGLTVWAGETRILRGQALGLRGRDFIMAAKVSGESTWRIVFGEFVPNMISRIVAGFILTFTQAIYFEAGLEFIGFGDAHQVTWGTALYWAANGAAVLSGYWWNFVFPGMAITLTVVALVFMQYAVDEVSNPKLRNLPKKQRRRHALRSVVERALNGRATPSGATR
jgi:peptide/nickel transport system permease protein